LGPCPPPDPEPPRPVHRGRLGAVRPGHTSIGTAYHFQVYAAGQQLDALHFNDTDFDHDWTRPGNPRGDESRRLSVEMKIPFASCASRGREVMGFNVYRLLSRRKEEGSMAFRPNGRSGDISRLGLLDGIEASIRASAGIAALRGLKALRHVPAYAKPRAELGSCATAALDAQRQGAVCAGSTSATTWRAIWRWWDLNPDFGQVEADQLC